jgi:Kef-type K+ transport system membrane component KefB
MKIHRKQIVIIASGILLFAMIALYRLFPYLFRQHAQKVESDYFIIACIICGTMPFTIALLYAIYSYLQQLKEKQQAEDEKKFYSKYIESKK